MGLLESAIDSTRNGLVFLAPARGFIPSLGWRVHKDDRRHKTLLHSLQKLRGRVYLEDGAITESQLTTDGRYWQAADSASWHLLAVDDRADVCGCARFTPYSAAIGFDDLGIRTSALARCQCWGMTLRAAVETEVARARRLGVAFAEVGGWAINAEKRFTTEALRIALATYGLAQLLGGCVGITTATVRHHSARILRRIGGRPLNLGQTELPSYYDPQYKCQMEVLRFDSANPDADYRRSVDRLRDQLLSVTVVAPDYTLAGPCPASVPASNALLWQATV